MNKNNLKAKKNDLKAKTCSKQECYIRLQYSLLFFINWDFSFGVIFFSFIADLFYVVPVVTPGWAASLVIN